MDIRQLRYFIAIVEARSFSRAAERLRIAQPALSQHVLAMEAELGVALLHRAARGVVPTEAGARLLDHARAIDASLAALPDHVHGRTLQLSGEVRFGMPGTVSEQLGVPLIEAVRLRYPDIRLRIAEAMSGFVAGWLREGTVDIALLYAMADEKGLAMHQALTEEIRLFGSVNMPGAPRGDTVGLAAALTLPLIVPSPSHGLRNLIDAAALSIGKHVDPAIEIDSYRQIKRLAARSLAFGMLPTMAINQEMHDGTFRSWRIVRPTLVRRIFLAYRADRPLSAAARAVGQLSWGILRDAVRSKTWDAVWTDRDELRLYDGVTAQTRKP
jgi:LysR family transcriptional regulator, nitrogen assimilation regulatory protein